MLSDLPYRNQAVVGAADGVTIALDLAETLHSHPAAIVLAAIGAEESKLTG